MSDRSTAVAFHADTSGEAPLTWGQQRVAALAAALHPGEATLNLRFACRLAEGVTPDAAARALGRAVERCESLRTRYDWADPDAPQVVHAEGVLDCSVRTLPEVDTRVAYEVADELAAAPFRGEEWPLRACVLRSDAGAPAFIVLVISHIAADFFGVDFLLWHLRDVLPRGPGRAVDPGPAPGRPRDISAWESTPAALDEARRAVARHARALRRMPQSMIPRLPVEPLTPRYRYLELRSAAMSRCLAFLGGEHGVSETAVFQAALAALLAVAGGVERCHLQLCVTNRAHAGAATAVAPLTQDVPVCVEVAGADFATLARRCAATLVTAVALGRFPPKWLDDARREVERDRAMTLDLSYWLNSRLRPRSGPAARPAGAELRALRAKTSIAEVGADRTSTSTVFTYVERDGDELVVRVLVDSAFVRPAEAEKWLAALESVLVEAVDRPDAPAVELVRAAGVAPPVRGADWVVVDHSPVHLPTAAACAARALGAGVRLEVDEDGRLVAHVVGDAPRDGSAPPDGNAPPGEWSRVVIAPRVVDSTGT